jgi:hypothetical protein
MRISIDQFIDDYKLDQSVTPRVFSSAIRVAHSSGVSLVMAIDGEQFLTTLKGRLSPALNLFAYQCGSAEVALVCLGMLGAAVPAYIEKSCWDSIRKDLNRG